MKNKDFAVFIISHGRPDNVVTYKTLKKCGYSDRIYYIVDNEDKTIEQYKKNFGDDNVVIFDKKAIADKVDEGNNFDDRKTTTHARNACFEIAEKLDITYFIVLDDDYINFRYRFIDKYTTKGYVKNLDVFFDIMLEYFIKSSFHSIAFAQGGDFIDGESCGLITNYLYISRKCMNSFICSTERPFQFVGQLNEDVNTYVTLGSKGYLFLTVPFIGLEQLQTQGQSGGMTEAYLQFGTYCKSFTTVMMHPSSVKVSMMGFTSKRLHHSIKWKNTIPLIINEKYKK